LGKFARKLLSPGEATAVIILFAFNPLVAQFSGILMPTVFYTAAVIASYLLMDDLLKKATFPKALGLGFLLGWGSLIRLEGVLLLISISATLVLTRKGREFLLVMILPMAIWLLVLHRWWRMHQGAHTEFGGDLAALVTYWSHHLVSGIRFAGLILQDFLYVAVTARPPASNAKTFLLSVIVI